MKRLLIIVLSYIVFIAHVIATLVVLFGSFIPEIRLLYQLGLLITIASWIVTSGCFLTVWEYKLRKIINPNIEIYEYGFIDYHLRKFFKGRARPQFIYIIGLFFLITSLLINIITYGIGYL